MSAQHTPGPWQFYVDTPSTEPNWHIVTNASRMRVIANIHIEPGNAMDEANAQLISSAPDLLEALKDVLRIARTASIGVTVNKVRLERAEKAIAKAEGRQA